MTVKRDFVVATNERIDERLRFFEDSEWATRLARKGLELRYNEMARGAHLHRTTVDSSLRRMRALGEGAATHRDVSPETFDRITNGVFEPGKRGKALAIGVAPHPIARRRIESTWCKCGDSARAAVHRIPRPPHPEIRYDR